MPYYRLSTVDGANIGGLLAATPSFVTEVDDVATRITRIIMEMRIYWYEMGSDPLDADALQRMDADHAIYGRVAFNLLLEQSSPFNIRFSVRDPGAGGTGIRTGGGFLQLNANLLETGGDPMALYVSENQKINARWQLVADSAGGVLVPGNVPDAVGVELRGYTMPTSEFKRVMEAARG